MQIKLKILAPLLSDSCFYLSHFKMLPGFTNNMKLIVL